MPDHDMKGISLSPWIPVHGHGKGKVQADPTRLVVQWNPAAEMYSIAHHGDLLLVPDKEFIEACHRISAIHQGRVKAEEKPGNMTVAFLLGLLIGIFIPW